tara:strand:- start:6712 stop:7050 length:339 start_codon:yes stop_codon:yes gene_type:complete
MSYRVEATKIDEKHIYYDCQTCYTIHGGRVVKNCFKANGNFYKSSRQTVHKHGNPTGTYENRIERRSSHCVFSNLDVEIEITDNTLKPALPMLMNALTDLDITPKSVFVHFD